MDDLLVRWRGLVDNEAAGRELLARWSEPHRRYHDIDHLRAVLRAIDELARHASDADAVRLAAWFHDAVYRGRPGRDERESAELAASILPSLGVEAARVTEVIRLVELTATHQPAPADANGAVLCDADLAVLGGDPDAYAAYAAAVRAEYEHVPDGEFRTGRIAVLERFASRDPLFHTSTARNRWEPIARRNIDTELSLLRGGASAS
jgi:predicted metal-dependent HD superfamily phosphohydrolase